MVMTEVKPPRQTRQVLLVEESSQSSTRSGERASTP